MHKFTALLGIGAFFAFQTGVRALPITLGAAGPNDWAILEVGNGSIVEQVDLSNPQGGIFGNVGIQKAGKIQGSGPQIYGDLYLGDGASAQFSGTYLNNQPVTGTVHLGSGATVSPNSYLFTTVSDNPQLLLGQTRTDAINASSAAGALSPTSTLTQINLSHTSLTLAPGVYDLSALHLDHSTLTLSGAGSFVFNISSIFTLNSGKILLAGGATEQDVLFNYTGTNQVAFSGGGNDSELHGIILALNADVALAPGLVVGEIISGQDISVVSGAIIRQTTVTESGQAGRPPDNVPDNSSTLALILISFGFLILLKRFGLGLREG